MSVLKAQAFMMYLWVMLLLLHYHKT